MTLFTTERDDGRADRRVVADLAADLEPDDILSYDDLITALSDGVEVEVTKERAGRAVRDANPLLLKEQSRAMAPVRGVGYRIARAAHHQELALARRDRADVQMRKGLELLHNVRWDEMHVEQQLAHRGTLMVLDAVARQLRDEQARADTIEGLVRDLLGRVDKLEDDGQGEPEPEHPGEVPSDGNDAA